MFLAVPAYLQTNVTWPPPAAEAAPLPPSATPLQQEDAAVSAFPSADASQNSSTGTTGVMAPTSSAPVESQAPRALGSVAAAVAGLLVAWLALL